MKVDERIHILRELSGMTQRELANKLHVTRSSVNAWEMGISIPSPEKLAALSLLFKTSSDYILGIDSKKTLLMDQFTLDEQELLYRMVQYFENSKKL
ncbi:MAG: helix-turn-helix transcriptional regulator [bacterium]|nr:helix-turn-helix transcriptional regulator [bacterium]